MSMRLIEGFDYLPNTNCNGLLAARGWFIMPYFLGPWSWSATTGRFGFGKAIAVNSYNAPTSGGAPAIYKPLPSPLTTGVVGGAFNIGSNHNGVGGFSFFDALSQTPQVSVSFTFSGIVKVWRGWANFGVLLGQTSPGAFRASQSFYAEAKATIDPSVGAVEVRINKVVVLSLVNLNTRATSNSGFSAFGSGAPYVQGVTESWTIDDLYCLDTAGTINNDYLGNVRVQTQFTAAPGASSQFTPTGASSNWQAAQNFNVDDRMYDASGTVGAEDLYVMQALVRGSRVHAAQFSGFYRADDATQVTAATAYRPSTVTYTLPGKAVNTTYTSYEDIVEINPDTGLQFTGAEINVTQMGPTVSAIG